MKEIGHCEILSHCEARTPFIIRQMLPFQPLMQLFELAALEKYQTDKSFELRESATGRMRTFSFPSFLDYFKSEDNECYYLSSIKVGIFDLHNAVKKIARPYFTNWLDRLPAEADPRMIWLFIGKTGCSTPRHTDVIGSDSWHYLIQGRKQWQVWDSLHVGAPSAYFVQMPGDLVYLPGECPHAVSNLQDSIAVTENFIDKPGHLQAMHYCEKHAPFWHKIIHQLALLHDRRS